MADIVGPEVRSRMMAGIRGRNTKGEVLIRKELHRRGFRYRINAGNLPGKPDIVLPRYRTVILFNGCFWHGHTCPLFRWPKTRQDFWRAKIEGNRARDAKVRQELEAAGWRVGTVWECALKAVLQNPAPLIDDIAAWVKTGTDRKDWAL